MLLSINSCHYYIKRFVHEGNIYLRTLVFNTISRWCRILKSDAAGAICGVGTAYPSGALRITNGFQWGSCYLIFSFSCGVLQTICLYYLFRITFKNVSHINNILKRKYLKSRVHRTIVKLTTPMLISLLENTGADPGFQVRRGTL